MVLVPPRLSPASVVRGQAGWLVSGDLRGTAYLCSRWSVPSSRLAKSGFMWEAGPGRGSKFKGPWRQRLGGLDGIESFKLYVETPIPTVAAFGDKTYKEVIKVK